MRTLGILSAVALLAASAAGIAHSAPQQAIRPLSETARGAELRVLGSPRVFWRWGGTARRLVDPKSRLMRTGTKATCRLRTNTAKTVSFVCSVHRSTDSVKLLYVVHRTAAFTLRRL